jgi:hypothetical protein
MPKTPPSPKSDKAHAKARPKPEAKPRRGDDFGQEGTNKTIPVPKPDGAESEELGNNTPHIEKSPYTRG